MKKVVLIPDSFKGTMSSTRICEIMKSAVHRYYPDTEVVSVPVADGGEGSVDAFLSAMGGKKVELPVKGPYFEEVTGFYGVVDGATAIIEMAACAGLPMVGDKKCPDLTTTYGVGQLMVHAAEHGCKRIVVGLGGSATNDAGAGAAAAAGVKFYDNLGNEFIPTGGTLAKIHRIDMSGLHSALKGLPIVTMCDIDNPLYGGKTARRIFLPRKRARMRKWYVFWMKTCVRLQKRCSVI